MPPYTHQSRPEDADMAPSNLIAAPRQTTDVCEWLQSLRWNSPLNAGQGPGCPDRSKHQLPVAGCDLCPWAGCEVSQPGSAKPVNTEPMQNAIRLSGKELRQNFPNVECNRSSLLLTASYHYVQECAIKKADSPRGLEGSWRGPLYQSFGALDNPG